MPVHWRHAIAPSRAAAVPAIGAVLAVASALAARLLHGHAPGSVFSLLVVAWLCGLVLVATRWARGPRFRLRGVDRTTAIDLVMLFSAALAWRLLGIGGLPANLLGDEGAHAGEAIRFASGHLANPFAASDWYGVPLLYPWLVSWPIRMFGTQPWVWRSLTAVAGAAAVPVLYLAVRKHLVGPGLGARSRSRSSHIAMLAALALCFQHLSLYFSRLGANQGFDPLFLAATLLCLFHAFRQPQGAGWYGAGVVAGLGFHFYFAQRGIALITLAIVAVASAQQVSRTAGPTERVRAAAGPLLWVVVGFVLAALPLLVGPSDTATLMARTIQVFDVPGSGGGGLSWAGELSARIVIGLRSIQGLGLRGWYESGAGILVTRLELLLVVIGGARVARSTRHGWIYPAYLLGIVGAAAIFTENPVGSQRVTAAAVPAAVLVAIGAHHVGQLIWPRKRALVGTVIVAGIAVANVAHLFLTYLPRRENDITALVATEIIRTLDERPDIGKVIFCGGEKMGWQSDSVLPMMTARVTAFDVNRSWDSALVHLVPGTVVITAPTCPELRDRLLVEPTVAATQRLLRTRLGPRAALDMLMATGGRGYLRDVRADLPGVRYSPDEVEVFTLFEAAPGG